MTVARPWGEDEEQPRVRRRADLVALVRVEHEERPGPAAPVPLELVWVLEGDGMLFLRYRVRR